MQTLGAAASAERDLLPTAHDMLREYRVLSALSAFDVRTPQPVLACEDRDVLGVPFYLMQRVDGIVIRETLPEVFEAREERRRLGEELIDALAELHAVQWQGTDLEGIGRPQGYLERQLKRWAKQYELTVPHTRPLPGLEAVGDWLHQRLPPASEATVVPGDYKVDNVMFGVSRPARLVAIFDWEMATLGDPLSDLGWLLSFWGPTGDERDTPDLIDSNAMTQCRAFYPAKRWPHAMPGAPAGPWSTFPFIAAWRSGSMPSFWRACIDTLSKAPRPTRKPPSLPGKCPSSCSAPSGLGPRPLTFPLMHHAASPWPGQKAS